MINKVVIIMFLLLINIIPSVYSSNQEKIGVSVFVAEKPPETIEIKNTTLPHTLEEAVLKKYSLVTKTVNKIKKFIFT